jgi:hypothetical protein
LPPEKYIGLEMIKIIVSRLYILCRMEDETGRRPNQSVSSILHQSNQFAYHDCADYQDYSSDDNFSCEVCKPRAVHLLFLFLPHLDDEISLSINEKSLL